MEIFERTKEIKSREDLKLDGENKAHNRKQKMSDVITKVECCGMYVVPVFVGLCVNLYSLAKLNRI